MPTTVRQVCDAEYASARVVCPALVLQPVKRLTAPLTGPQARGTQWPFMSAFAALPASLRAAAPDTRSGSAAAAPSSKAPDGNHGEYLSETAL